MVNKRTYLLLFLYYIIINHLKQTVFYGVHYNTMHSRYKNIINIITFNLTHETAYTTDE